LIATPLREHFDLANIVMLFLLTVVLVAVRLGRGPAVAAAFLSVAAFDFFFVPPRFSFAVSDIPVDLARCCRISYRQMTAGLRHRRIVVSRGACTLSL
jgi:two-component system sensor histidine kinase KdpD